MRNEPTQEELFAAEVMRRATGWDLVYGDAETSGAVDWLILGEDGEHLGGVEVTICGDQRTLETMRAAGETYWELPAAKWCWMLTYGRRVDFRDVRRHLEPLVLLCEAHDVVAPELLTSFAPRPASLAWYLNSDVSLYGFSNTSRSGVVDVVPEGHGGAADDDASALLPWLEREFEGRLGPKVARFNEVKGVERHLFLIVHDSGMPFAEFYALNFTGSLPSHAPKVPAALTGLWLLPPWGHAVLRWQEGDGWTRFAYGDNRAES